MSDNTAPDVSVTLLTRNAGPLLERVLRAIREQKTDLRVEIVAVDSGSTDKTREILAQYGARVSVIPPESFNFGLTRDLVFEQSSAPIVISLSQDAVPAHAQWLEHLVAPLAENNVAVSCGRSLPDEARQEPQFIWERNGRFYFTREMRTFFQRYGRGLSNSNAAYMRSVWSRLRFGEQSIGEDFRMQTKLHAENLAIAFPDDAPVLHHHNYTLKTLFARCRNEGRGLCQLGCPYSAAAMMLDIANTTTMATWCRELLRGRLTTPAALLFPLVRPFGVYVGSRRAKSVMP
ncbi:MAG: glycosyltransferase [Candidatus Hydrogenedentes bacterium]|nr:glycosyltransferase [Candidatus Hydrogenedentota bacterium]